MNTVNPSRAPGSRSIVAAFGIVAASMAPASALATIVIDDFTQSQAAITAWDNAANGTTVQGSFMSAASGWTDARFGSSGAGILGRRYVATNSWGAPDTTVSASMAGNGQFAVSLFGGSYADNQMVAQYKFGSAIDMSQAATSQVRIAGSGTASGGTGAYGIGIVLFSNLRFGTVQVGWDESTVDGDGNNPPVYGPGIGYDGRFSIQLDMSGSRSLGDFTFDVADFVPAGMRSSINGMQVFQYAYGASIAGSAGTWNYTATSFSIVPAPGALALLGVAGMAGRGRRR